MPTEKQQDLLAPVRAILSGHERWTKHTYAEDADGYIVRPESVAACKWCLVGAVIKAYPSDGMNDQLTRAQIFGTLRKRIGKRDLGFGIPYWQDRPGREFADIEEILREPIYAQPEQLP